MTVYKAGYRFSPIENPCFQFWLWLSPTPRVFFTLSTAPCAMFFICSPVYNKIAKSSVGDDKEKLFKSLAHALGE